MALQLDNLDDHIDRVGDNNEDYTTDEYIGRPKHNAEHVDHPLRLSLALRSVELGVLPALYRRTAFTSFTAIREEVKVLE